jgi:glutamyl-tRNA synthetase
MLAHLGWNAGTEQEIFSMEELIEKFSMERVHKNGAKFNYEKALWFNREWIKKLPLADYLPALIKLFEEKGIDIKDKAHFSKIMELVKDRCTLLPDFVTQASYFFQPAETIDITAIQPKWNEQKATFFLEFVRTCQLTGFWQRDELEKAFKEIASVAGLKPGELMLPFRIMLVGGKFGPDVFDIAALLGKEETIERMITGLKLLSE